jgi:Transposase, Mutator family
MAAAAPACGVLDLSCHVAGAISSWFTSLVTSAVSPLFALIGRTLLDTIAGMLGRQFPKMQQMLRDAEADVTAFAAFPVSHWKKTWPANPLSSGSTGKSSAPPTSSASSPTRPPCSASPTPS